MCLICERIEKIKNGTNPYFVKELETGYVVIGDHQYFKGYTLFLCKQHKAELFFLEDIFKERLLKEMSLVAQAVYHAFNANKINYELLGNSETHLHWHLFPRKPGDAETDGPVWLVAKEKLNNAATLPTQEELDLMKEKLNHELDLLF